VKSVHGRGHGAVREGRLVQDQRRAAASSAQPSSSDLKHEPVGVAVPDRPVERRATQALPADRNAGAIRSFTRRRHTPNWGGCASRRHLQTTAPRSAIIGDSRTAAHPPLLGPTRVRGHSCWGHVGRPRPGAVRGRERLAVQSVSKRLAGRKRSRRGPRGHQQEGIGSAATRDGRTAAGPANIRTCRGAAIRFCRRGPQT
jgi:hypothetical protein